MGGERRSLYFYIKLFFMLFYICSNGPKNDFVDYLHQVRFGLCLQKLVGLDYF